MTDVGPIIQIQELRRRFGKQIVLNGLSLDICRGDVLAIIGRSGTGKSVLLKHIIGLLRPDSGRVLIANEDMHRRATQLGTPARTDRHALSRRRPV